MYVHVRGAVLEVALAARRPTARHMCILLYPKAGYEKLLNLPLCIPIKQKIAYKHVLLKNCLKPLGYEQNHTILDSSGASLGGFSTGRPSCWAAPEKLCPG